MGEDSVRCIGVMGLENEEEEQESEELEGDEIAGIGEEGM
jgi:hypothetical protein